jgi:hypothetical protein
LRYQPQKSINIGYQADKKYLNVELARLVNKSFIKQYDNRLISFTASFQTISDDFWIYGQLGQVSQVERSRYFLALISPIRAFSLTGVLIDKGKFDDILKISANSIVKIEGYATVRDAFVKVSSSQYVLAENAENLLIEAHQIQVIC